MHVLHLANYWSSSPLSVSIEDRSYITELPVGLFSSVSPTLVPAVVESVSPEVASVPKPESVDSLAGDWKCVYRKFVLPEDREDDDNVPYQCP